jgi:predicted phosphate transport protein (TIGR00153 family)
MEGLTARHPQKPIGPHVKAAGLAAVAHSGHHARVRFKVIPTDEGFYELFVRAAQNNLQAAEFLRELFVNYSERERLRERIRQAEHEGDEITHTVIRRMNTTFVTPFDREDIYNLASGLDDVMDHIDAAADFVLLHNLLEPLPEHAKQADVLVRGAAVANEALQRLRSLKGLEQYWVEINRLENEGDQIYRKTVAHLFSGDFKAMEVFRHQHVVEEIEEAMDSLEDVANVIESIVLKHA